MPRELRDVVFVDGVRTPFGKAGSLYAETRADDLVVNCIRELLRRHPELPPERVDEVAIAATTQVGDQGLTIGRTAALLAGLPRSVPGFAIDRMCAGAMTAVTNVASAIGVGAIDVAVAGGVEVMSRVPIGSNVARPLDLGVPVPKTYFPLYEYTSQFEGAERIAAKWGVTRADTDGLGFRSQQLGAQAWAEDRFGTQVLPLDAPDLGEDGKPTGTTHHVARDEGLRDTTLETLGNLKAVVGDDGVHTAGTSSQISDGASAVLMMTAEKAEALGVTPLARIVDTCLVGVDPVLMLTGPIDATRHLLARNDLSIGDIDLFEINEAFASVVLAWQRELDGDLDRVNPNGGAIALGHPLGATGTILLTKAVHELQRSGGQRAIVTMCCGGGLGTGTLIERI